VGPVGEIVNKAEYPNHVWSYDFVEDRIERGGKLRILAIIDEYTRECLAMRIAPSIPALAVVGVLEWLFLTRGVPKFLRSDNGPEFVARAVCQWLKEGGCQTLFINPGSPWENGYIFELLGVIIIFVGFLRSREIFGLYRFPLIHGFRKVSAD